MNKINHWFTLVELIITITIIAVLSSISYLSIDLVSESNIKNKSQDAKTFIEDLKTDILRGKSSEVHVFFSSQNLQNKYIFWYSLDNKCDNITNIDNLFLSWYILDKYDYIEFSWSILSGSIIWESEPSRNNFEKLSFSWITNSHSISSNNKYIYHLYGTGTINIDGKDIPSILHCWDIKVYFFDDKSKNKYQINKVWLKSNWFLQYKNYMKLKFNNTTFKPELYVDGINYRIFFDQIIISLKDISNDLKLNIEL